MPSIVDICNRALSKLGQIRITSLSDNVKAAKACDAAYALVRDAVLRSHPWNCAVERVNLAALSTSPAHGYDNQYQLPSDCLRVLEVDTTYDWQVEGRKVMTDEGPSLNIVYLKRETDPNQYDSLLVETIAARLAYELCEELTQSNTKKQEAFQEYRELLKSAKMVDAQEGNPSSFAEDDWVNARY